MSTRSVRFSHSFGELAQSFDVTSSGLARFVLPWGTPTGQATEHTRVITTDQTVKAGQILESALIRARVTVQEGGILRNAKVVGNSASRPSLVSNYGLVEDVTIIPDNPDGVYDGIRMLGNSVARRLDIGFCGDAAGIISGAVTMEDIYEHDAVMLSPDPGRTNDAGHHDMNQIHGGDNHRLVRFYIDAYFTSLYGAAGKPATRNAQGVLTGGNPRYDGRTGRYQAMSAIMFNKITSFPHSLYIGQSVVNGGIAAFNLGGLGTGDTTRPGYTLGTIEDITFNTDQGNHPYLAAIGNPKLPMTWRRNTYTDGRAAVVTGS